MSFIEDANLASSSRRTMSDDIYLLAGILGQVLHGSSGASAFGQTETARALAKALRGGDPGAGLELDVMVRSLNDDEAETLVRAFTNYFQLVNLAEDSERIRRIRNREAADSKPRRGSLREAIALLRDNGVDAEHLGKIVSSARIRLVLTAHPTEARRRTIIAKLARIFAALRDLDERSLLPDEERQLRGLLAHTIEEVWYSEEIRTTKLTVLDEVHTSLVYLLSTFVTVVPRLYRDLEDAISEFYPEAAISVPPLLIPGTWIGGDRDGNPNVTAELTEHALATMRNAALGLIDGKLLELAGRLSIAQSIAGRAETIRPLIESLSEKFPEAAENLRRINAGEPYRQAISLIRERVHATAGDLPTGYPNSAAILDDLRLIDRSLRLQGGDLIADGDFRDVIRVVEVFGFHLAVMDIREHAQRNTAALAEVFARTGVESDYVALSESDRAALLTREIDNQRPLIPRDLAGHSSSTAEIVRTFRTIDTALSGRHQGAVETYIISGAEVPSDVLAVLLLMKESGLAAPGGGEAKLSIAPLFEQAESLRNAPETMRTLLDNAPYRRALASQGNAQEVMIGYSDSNKEVGFLGSAWALYRAQAELTDCFNAAGVQHTFFHGRGGAIGRGGGPTNVAILSQPPGAVEGRVKLTEQGEVIASRYATAPIAYRELELVASAALASAIDLLPTPPPERLAHFGEIMEAMTAASIAAYRDLVYGDEEFVRFFEEATPISEIARLQIGSRPARRQQTHRIEDLRAIPWVFSWTQSRFLLPGWYGLGAGLELGRQRFGLDQTRAMEREWPFFSATVGNAEMALAKSDLDIAERYAGLVRDHSLRIRIWERIRDEHARSLFEVLLLTGQERLLERDPVLRRSIDRRNPYVDPLSFVQVELLRRIRAGDASETSYRTILRTINGIAGGLKGTG